MPYPTELEAGLGVLKYITRRLIGAIPVLFGLSILVFAIVHLIPGDPVKSLLGQHATPELTREIMARMGLDKPLYEQYLLYLSQLLQGDLGKSVINNRLVIDELFSRFPATIELTLGAMALAIGIGVPLGRWAARHTQGWGDGLVTVISLLGVSIPIFVLGYTLQYIFAAQLHWLPASGRVDPRIGLELQTNFVIIDSILTRNWQALWDAIRHLILPAIALGTIPLAIITRITRRLGARCLERGLRADRPGQGVDRQARQRPPHHAERLAPGDDRHRPAGRRSARGRGDHRDGLLVAGRRQLHRQRHPGPRLPRRAVRRS